MSKLKIRGIDKWGNGAFGAPRDGGTRKHVGVDIVTRDGEPFLSLNAGTITRLGYVYKGNYTFRLIEVTCKNGDKWRYFYVDPVGKDKKRIVELGLKISVGQILGTTQSLQLKYPGITPHVHFEIIKNGEYIDPTEIVEND